jgi:hypothetical protein
MDAAMHRLSALVQLLGVTSMTVGFAGVDWRAGCVAGGLSALWVGWAMAQ